MRELSELAQGLNLLVRPETSVFGRGSAIGSDGGGFNDSKSCSTCEDSANYNNYLVRQLRAH
jgi:hypothetical protein